MCEAVSAAINAANIDMACFFVAPPSSKLKAILYLPDTAILPFTGTKINIFGDNKRRTKIKRYPKPASFYFIGRDTDSTYNS
jgi:hypothetical protein